MFSRNFLMVSALSTFAFGLAGCRPLPPSKPSSEWTPQEARGADVYQANCARCHYPTSTQSSAWARATGDDETEGDALRRAAH